MLSPTKRRVVFFRAIGLAFVATAALIWAIGSVAAAAPGDSGDPRATAFSGNAVTCAGAGLPGQILITSPDSSGASNQFVTVTSDGTFLDVTVQPGVTVTGVVVKGGPNYNVYPGGLFVDGSENDLHAPLVGNDSIPMISHWFICGTTGTTTTTATTTTGTTTTGTTTTGTTTTGTTTTGTTTTGTTTTGTTTTGTTTTGTTTTGTTTTGTTTTGTTTTTTGPSTTKTTTPSMTTTSGGGGGLPNTGSPATALGLLAFGLLAVGAGLVLFPGQLLGSPKH